MKKVMVFGTFDILHTGHLNLMWQARGLGDYLIVVIARDKTVKKIKERFPLFDENTRLNNLKKLKIADKLILGSKGENKHSVIDKFKPNVIALGYDQKNFIDKLKNKYGNIIKIVRLKSFYPNKFKSSIIKRRLDK